MNADQVSTKTKLVSDRNFLDQRAAASFVLYPKPFGVQAEYNIGNGPQFNPARDSVEVKPLRGGYITLSYSLPLKHGVLLPFVRYQHYVGAKKHELDARSYEVSEGEVGLEWQPSKAFELVAMYTMSNRKTEDYVLRNNFQSGRLLRLQAQINF